jgi:hypothetical protein
MYERKKIASKSLRQYFKKNGTLWQKFCVNFFIPPVLVYSKLVSFFKPQTSLKTWFKSESSAPLSKGPYVLAVSLFVLLEALSLVSHMVPAIAFPLLLLFGVMTFLAARRNSEWGIYILFAELFIGGRGHLLEYEINGFSISLRLLIFAAVFFSWGLKGLPGLKNVPKSYWLLLTALAMGVGLGFSAGNGFRNIFLDANGYLFLLIFPAAVSAVEDRRRLENLFEILAAAVSVIAVKTLILFVWFTYNWSGVSILYNWIISKEIGEITALTGGIPRIFMQSQFYSLMGLLIFGLAEKKRWKIISAGLFSVIAGFSRSFWLGAGGSVVFALGAMRFAMKIKIFRILRLVFLFFLICAIQVAGLYLISNLGGQKLGQAVTSRIDKPAEDAAGNARLLLFSPLWEEIKTSPVVGKGFGREVAYSSYLPDKITPENPEGVIKSFAFEWGYLDTALKIGFLGLIIYLIFIASIFQLGLKKIRDPNLQFHILGVASGLVALLTLNITTPFLNHPLGIGYLILSFLTFRDYEQAAR